MPLDLLNRKDPLLKGVDPAHLQAFDPAKAGSHLSTWHLRKLTGAQIFVGHALVKLWHKELGGAHLLNDERMTAITKALAEYSPKQVANAIRAYAAECRRRNSLAFRLTFEKFMGTTLQTWVVAGNGQSAAADRDRQKIDELREHRDFLAAWSGLDNAEQSRLLRQAGRGFIGANPTTSNPLFRAELRKLMGCGTGVSPVDSAGSQPTAQSSQLPPTIEQLRTDFEALGPSGRSLLIQEAAKQLEKRGYFAGCMTNMANPRIRTRVYQILQQRRRQQPGSKAVAS